MRAGIFTTTIENVKDIGTNDSRHFRLAFDPGTVFEFDAGQFVNIFIPSPEKTFKRPYSIASSPTWSGFIDICWKKVPGGSATSYLWTLKEGDKLDIQGPLGRFTLPQELPEKVVFISTGTGIAPFRAMMHSLIEKKAPVEMVNIFGNRYEDDILYQAEFEALAAKNSNFRNVFTISRPKNWTGETEYVQEMLRKYVPATPGTRIYICGLTAMIQEVEKTALELGFDKKQIHYEKYD